MFNDPDHTLTHDEYLLFDALTDLMTIALERIRLFLKLQKKRLMQVPMANKENHPFCHTRQTCLNSLKCLPAFHRG